MIVDTKPSTIALRHEQMGHSVRQFVMEKKRMRAMFIQDWGTYPGNTLVCCQFGDYGEAIAELKSRKWSSWATALKLKKDQEDLSGAHHFSRWTVMDTKKKIETTYSILWLKTWLNDLEHYKILAHELVHAIQFLMKDYLDPLKEYEAVAYQHSYLFEQIAKKLNGKN